MGSGAELQVYQLNSRIKILESKVKGLKSLANRAKIDEDLWEPVDGEDPDVIIFNLRSVMSALLVAVEDLDIENDSPKTS